jgi:hypothetical protein
MNWTNTISAAALVTASIATPAFAQTAYGPRAGAPYDHGQTYYRSNDVPPGSYAPRNGDEYRNQENFGFSGRDPSRVGGESPNLNPPS